MASVTKFFLSRTGVWRIKCAIAGEKDRYRLLPKGTTEEQAEAIRAAWLEQIATSAASPYAAPASLGAFIAACAELQTHLAQSTRARYAELRAHLGRLAEKKLTAIRLADAADLQRRLLAEGLHPNTVRHIYQCAHAGLAEAVRAGLLPADPWQHARGIRAPRPVIDLPAADAIAAAIGRIPGRTGLLLRLALASGCRRGELLGLTWADIDPAGAIRIQRGLECDRTGAIIVSPPKTRRSRRTVTLPASAMAELATLRLDAARAALAAGVPLATRPVIPGDDGGWWHPLAATKAAARALRRTGLAATLHTLRHAHATALLSGAVNPAHVQARLGHASMQTTLGTYGHALPADDAHAVAVIGAAIAQHTTTTERFTR